MLLLRNVLFAAAGLVAFLIWTSFVESGRTVEAAAALPEVVFDGGGGRLELEFATTHPAELVFAFERHDPGAGEERGLGGRERVEPGEHRRSVDVPPETSVHLELGVPDARPGAEIGWAITVDGDEVVRAADRLEQPLEAGSAFFLQAEAGDVEELRGWR